MAYQGSHLFASLAIRVGLSIDQLNFLIAEGVALFIGILIRKYVRPKGNNVLKRHLICSLIGFLLALFCYGRSMIHLVIQSSITYSLLLYSPRRYVHLISFVFAMGYLSCMHIYRLIYEYGQYTLDVTGYLSYCLTSLFLKSTILISYEF